MKGCSRLPKGQTGALSLVLLAALLAGGNGCVTRREAGSEPDTSAPPPGAAAATPTPSPAPLTWEEVARGYERVRDYVCLYEKEERAISHGEMQTLRLSFRKPFDARMDWLNDRGEVDQTAVYRAGANNGKVLARQGGFVGGLMGKLRLDPNESLALADSRHPVTEAGLGKIIERAQRDASNPRIASRFVGEEALDGRPAYEFEFAAKDNEPVSGLTDARRALVWVDLELKLPVKLELYDAANALIERHRFKDVRVNQKLTDKTFTL
jgi:hypothetical protein